MEIEGKMTRPWPQKLIHKAEPEPIEITGWTLREPIEAVQWADRGCCWCINRELNILAHGENPEEARLRFLNLMINKKFAYLEFKRNGHKQEPNIEKIGEKIGRYL
jgi:hypothetical protein